MRNQSHRRIGLFALLSLLIPALIACGSSAPDAASGQPTAQIATMAPGVAPTAASSGAPRVLDLYNWGTFIDPAIVTDFEQKYNVKVNYDIYDNDVDLLADIEAKQTNRDVILPSDYMVAIMREKQLLHVLNRENVANLNKLDPIFINTPYDPGNRHCVPYQWGTLGIGYNIKATGRELSSWKDLFDPAFKGRVALLDDARAALGAMLINLGYSPNTSNANQISQARDLITASIDNIASFAPDTGQDLLISGTVDVAMEWSGDILQMSRANPDIRYVIPNEGTFITTTYICVAAAAAHADLGELFINYILEPEVSAKLSNFILYSSPVKDALPFINAADRQNPMLYPPEAVQQRLVFLVDVGGDTAKVYDSVWAEVLARQK